MDIKQRFKQFAKDMLIAMVVALALLGAQSLLTEKPKPTPPAPEHIEQLDEFHYLMRL